MPIRLELERLKNDLRFVEHQMTSASQSKWGTVSHMWSQRADQLADEISEASERTSKKASVALVFDGDPVRAATEIRLDFATEALQGYQKSVSLYHAWLSQGDVPSRGRITKSRESTLFIRETIRGSFGFILEEEADEQSELIETPLKASVEGITGLIHSLSTSDEDKLLEILQTTPGRLIVGIDQFMEVLINYNSSVKVFGDTHSVQLSTEQTAKLHELLGDIATDEDTMVVEGVLLGITPLERRFEMLITDGGQQEPIRGRISPAVVDAYTATNDAVRQLLMKKVNAEILVERTLRHGREISKSYILNSVGSGSDRTIGT